LQELKHKASLERDRLIPVPLHGKIKKLTLGEVIDKYEIWRGGGKDARGTSARLKKQFKYLLTHSINHLCHDNMIQIKQKMIDQNYAAKTVNNTFVMLRAAINRSMSEGWIRLRENPVDCQKIGIIPIPPTVRPILTPQQVDTLLEDTKPYVMLHLFTLLLYKTAARPAAILKLKVNSIDIFNNKILIGKLKGGYDYSVIVDAETMEHIKAHIEKYDITENNFLFHASQRKRTPNKPLSYGPLQIRLSSLMPKGMSPYSIRRTSATRIYEKHGIVIASKALGHTNLKSTMIYLNISADMKKPLL